VGSSYAQTLNPYKLKLLRLLALSLEAKEDSLLHPLHEFILGACLRVAARKSWNSSHQEAFGIPLNDDVVILGHFREAGILRLTPVYPMVVAHVTVADGVGLQRLHAIFGSSRPLVSCPRNPRASLWQQVT